LKSQAWHAPEHALAQQNPLTQWPVPHSLSWAHTVPWVFLVTQTLLEQYSLTLPQSLSCTHWTHDPPPLHTIPGPHAVPAPAAAPSWQVLAVQTTGWQIVPPGQSAVPLHWTQLPLLSHTMPPLPFVHEVPNAVPVVHVLLPAHTPGAQVVPGHWEPRVH
jgi:hypothetical protein